LKSSSLHLPSVELEERTHKTLQGKPLTPYARTPPFNGGTGSSSPTTAPLRPPLFEARNNIDEHDWDAVIDKSIAPHLTFRENQMSDINCSQAAGQTELVRFQELNQQINWSCRTINPLARFEQFMKGQCSDHYSLSKNRIADLTLSHPE
ncbi:hypothetical protein FBU30_001328, partial [Linnemannia zychae]